MDAIDVRVKKLEHGADLPLPAYQSAQAAGLDLVAAVEDTITIEPGARYLVPTGIAVSLPEGYEAQIRPRSGLAVKYGISLVNSPGTIDADYRGEIRVIVINHGHEPFSVLRGDRICQMVINKVVQARWEEVDDLDATARGAGGFGHTGV